MTTSEEETAAPGETDTTEASESTTTFADETTTTTTTTLPPTTTATAPTTTTTSGPDLTDPEVAVVFFIVDFDGTRDEVIEILESTIDVESVDKYIREMETTDVPTSTRIILDVTSGWSADSNQHDGAWEVTKGMSALYDDPDGLYYANAWVPDLDFTNSGRTYLCSGDFMVQLADSRKSMSDWEAECA